MLGGEGDQDEADQHGGERGSERLRENGTRERVIKGERNEGERVTSSLAIIIGKAVFD